MHLYVVRLDSTVHQFTRDDLRTRLKEEYQVGTAVHYPAVWDWEAFANDRIDHDRRDCPHAHRACREVLSLPVFPKSTADDMQYVAWAIEQSIADLR